MNIAILGAGIAGMSCAIALTQAGHTVTVYERNTDEHAGGGMVLWPNASFVLDQLGLLPAVAAAGASPRAMRRLSRNGAALQHLDIGQLDREMGHASHAILRRDLVAILADWLARHGVPIHYGVAGLALTTGADGRASLECADRAPISADLLIGADGRNRSVARQYVLGENHPRFQGFVNWVGAVEVDEDLVEQPGVQDFWGKAERFGVVSITPRKIYWAAAVAAPALDRLPAFDELYQRFADWPAPIPALLRQTPREQLRLIAVHDVDPVERWHRANVLMLGDAAHASLPTSGQGASQALEDAWHLPRCLAAHADNLDQALAAFTALRSPKTKGQTMGARQFANDLFLTDEAECQQRDARAAQVDPAQQIAAMAKGWASGLPMRDSATPA
ncbi:FAD-dependent monooxygenase [Rugamonas sp. CCM 8940]|uniref:FAD-dependent monooxygenase n=1 Tax=Rugamonas sp. CCM 8940 TaxID=2765359 RepID=UPI0018F7504F|nr:FAD-dependent monooxygenase [Rugamonas sp. CCM 8940]MBJ7311533.1 FAD-dependent monooxygenase [Rugamonas sp. CCM 8940]